MLCGVYQCGYKCTRVLTGWTWYSAVDYIQACRSWGIFFYLNFSFVSSCNFHVDAKNFFFSFLFFLILRNISRTRLWSVEVSARGMCVYNTDRSLLQHCCYSVRWPGSSQWWIKGINTHNLTGVWNNTENNTWFFLLLSLLLFFHNTDVTRQIR